MKKYQKLANEVGALVDLKNQAYGNSFDQAGDFLKLLYPDGIPPEKYSDMLCVVRIFDKLKRIATKKDALAESPYADLVGYGLLGLEKDNRTQQRLPLLQENKKENAPLSKETYEEEPPSSGSPSDCLPRCIICQNIIESAEIPKDLPQNSHFAHAACFENQRVNNEAMKKETPE